jgi:hypothetical protein
LRDKVEEGRCKGRKTGAIEVAKAAKAEIGRYTFDLTCGSLTFAHKESTL